MKYQIQGEPMPVVVCELNAGETLISESGAMAWMTSN
ncbi:MAG: AIM24 family protein, partial [Oscillospiraceae bacterium]|nr:AIM24 family protein [Oscillospiraceae bacterium]